MCRSVEADVDACLDWRIVVSAYSNRQQLDRPVLLNMEMDQEEAESRRLYPALLTVPRNAWKLVSGYPLPHSDWTPSMHAGQLIPRRPARPAHWRKLRAVRNTKSSALGMKHEYSTLVL